MCSNCGKEKMIDVYLLDTTYQEIINFFVLNTMLHHVGMLWIIENHEELKYDMDIQNSDWLAGVVHGMTHLFVINYMENYLRDLL